MGFEIICTSCGGSGETIESQGYGERETWELRPCPSCHGRGHAHTLVDPNEVRNGATNSDSYRKRTQERTACAISSNSGARPGRQALENAIKAIEEEIRKINPNKIKPKRKKAKS